MEKLRQRFDAAYTEFVKKQSKFVRGSVERKRLEVWAVMSELVRPYVQKAALYDDAVASIEAEKRIQRQETAAS